MDWEWKLVVFIITFIIAGLVIQQEKYKAWLKGYEAGYDAGKLAVSDKTTETAGTGWWRQP